MMCGYDKRVLDVGCSYGHLAQVLKDRGCTVVGVELDPEAAAEASEICERVIVGLLFSWPRSGAPSLTGTGSTSRGSGFWSTWRGRRLTRRSVTSP